ncbi:hypothetical protein [Streptomyces deccanensis]|nr:hypothetical protein [Streptomyces deccanensis]ULR56312.1 hypothetical protein L3078_40330 [Streptomyces deccanensis]
MMLDHSNLDATAATGCEALDWGRTTGVC